MLDEILQRTMADVPVLRERESEFAAAASRMPHPIGFRAALLAAGLGVIAEVKKRSPSRGMIDADLDPVTQAQAYEAGGAVAVSVLTEPHFFSGSVDDLIAVKDRIDLPVLRKDFVVDPVQVIQARAIGADAILLIMACLTDRQATDLLEEAATWSLDVLVEAHTAEEARRAVACGARTVGINNRDLSSFEVDLAMAERIAPLLPADVVRVAESGIWTIDDARRMRAAGYDAVLVGEALVRSDDPGALIRDFST